MAPTDVEVAIAAAEAGAESVARHYGSTQVRAVEGTDHAATRADLDSETAIMSVLAKHRPADARTGEETGTHGSASSPRRWLIDPLCGTMNFVATTPLFVVNVALIDASGSVTAAAADPITGEVFWTDGVTAVVRHRGRDAPLTPSATSGLIEINCDGPSDRKFVGGQLLADPRLRSLYGPRVISSTLAVAWTAAGRRAAYVSDGSFRTDLHFAAGIALCRAAGCIVTDLAGDPLHDGRGVIISANWATHHDVLTIVQPHLAAVTAST